jgi:murein DD-endopeptidase MepM/ murein hydrolase activator NlpD
VFALLVSPVASLCLIAPVTAPIVEPFVMPSCPYCPGNRAIDFAATADGVVRAPVDGLVHFAGSVAGRVYLTLRAGNHLVSVGGIGELATGLTRGRAIRQGQTVGSVGGSDDSVSLSVRWVIDPGEYLDPTPWLGRLVASGPRSRLVPLDGTPRRPAPRAVCRPGG